LRSSFTPRIAVVVLALASLVTVACANRGMEAPDNSPPSGDGRGGTSAAPGTGSGGSASAGGAGATAGTGAGVAGGTGGKLTTGGAGTVGVAGAAAAGRGGAAGSSVSAAGGGSAGGAAGSSAGRGGSTSSGGGGGSAAGGASGSAAAAGRGGSGAAGGSAGTGTAGGGGSGAGTGGGGAAGTATAGSGGAAGTGPNSPACTSRFNFEGGNLHGTRINTDYQTAFTAISNGADAFCGGGALQIAATVTPTEDKGEVVIPFPSPEDVAGKTLSITLKATPAGTAATLAIVFLMPSYTVATGSAPVPGAWTTLTMLLPAGADAGTSMVSGIAIQLLGRGDTWSGTISVDEIDLK
jgi:hypothetical protein